MHESTNQVFARQTLQSCVLQNCNFFSLLNTTTSSFPLVQLLTTTSSLSCHLHSPLSKIIFNITMQGASEFRNFRMGALIDPPPDPSSLNRINWNLSVLGHFFGPNPPAPSLVQGLINAQWVKHGSITIQRTGDYYIFTCSHRADVEALLQEHTTIIDSRIVTFRACH